MRRKTWEELEISDNFLFQQVMRNKRICKHLIEKVLGISIREITYPETEKTQEGNPDKKNVRLDVYVEDDTGTLYNIEMQTTNSPRFGGLAKRARYYGAQLDVNALKKGGLYRDLPKTYIIFICTFDAYGLSRSIYTFQRICRQVQTLEMGDETTMIFLCTNGNDDDVDPDIKAFLQYVDGKAAEGAFTRDIAAEVDRVKEHIETRREYMTFLTEIEEEKAVSLQEGIKQGMKQGLEKGLKQGMEKGMEKGMEQGQIFALRNLVDGTGWSIEKAMEMLKIPPTDQKKYAAILHN